MRIELKPVHRELMFAKNERLLEAQALLERRQGEFRGALQMVAQDLGANLKLNWHLVADFSNIACDEAISDLRPEGEQVDNGKI